MRVTNPTKKTLPTASHPGPKIRLADLLRRRRATFTQWVAEVGIQTYEQLTRYCHKMGICPPTEEEFHQVVPVTPVTVPTEGIVCVDVEPVRVIGERTGVPQVEAVDPYSAFSELETDPVPVSEEAEDLPRRGKKNRNKRPEEN